MSDILNRDKPNNYTRVVNLDYRRGDGALEAYVEYVGKYYKIIMQSYLNLDLQKIAAVIGDQHQLELHWKVIHSAYVEEVARMVENDEDLAKETLIEA